MSDSTNDSPWRTHHARSEAATCILFENSPAVAGLLLWANHKDAPENLDATFTDGKTVFYNEWFEKLPRPQQVFVAAHEILHIALCHPGRMAMMARREGPEWSHAIANIAVDVIVNQALLQQCRYGWMQQPDNTWTLDVLKQELTKQGWKGTLDAEELEFESLYRLIKQYAKKIKVNLGKGKGSGIDGDCHLPVISGDMAREEQEMREWARRVERSAHGDSPGGILRQLRDLPKTETPWESVLRTTLINATSASLTVSWQRPSRQYLALRTMGVGYEPGLKRKPRPKIVVCIDSSGSIGDDLFDRFIAEIRAIIAKTNASLTVIVGDAAVASVTHVEREDEVKRIPFKGRGGTDFRPLLTEALKWKPAYCVYLTDLAGSFPDRTPRFPVLWAVPEAYKDMQAPFGRILVLKD